MDRQHTDMQDDWRKASYSNGSGACVETASNTSTVAVRDTTDRDGRTLAFTADAWASFISGLK
jgi:Domain of unknown function (DUF397)